VTVAALAVIAAAAAAAAAEFGNHSLTTLGSGADVIQIPNRQGGNIQISTNTTNISYGKYMLSVCMNICCDMSPYRSDGATLTLISAHSRKASE